MSKLKCLYIHRLQGLLYSQLLCHMMSCDSAMSKDEEESLALSLSMVARCLAEMVSALIIHVAYYLIYSIRCNCASSTYIVLSTIDANMCQYSRMHSTYSYNKQYYICDLGFLPVVIVERLLC